MENIKVKWKKSLFSRMIITFILIIIPLYFIGAIVYNWAIQTVKYQISNTMLLQVDTYLDTLENQIKRIKLLQFDSMNDPDLRQLASIPESLDEYDKIQSVIRFQQRLVAIANSSEYIKIVRAYIPSVNRTITTMSGGYETSIDDKEFNALNSNMSTSGSRMIYWKDRLFLSVVYPTTDMQSGESSRKKPLFIVGAELSKEALKKALQQFNSYREGGAVLVDISCRLTLTSSNNTEVNSQIESLLKQPVITSRSGTKPVVIQSKPYLVIYSSSDYLGMTLYSFIPESEVFKELNRFYLWFWSFTVLAIIIIILYSFTTYRFIHKPMENLVKAFRKVENGELNIVIDHSHDDEFKYLYSRFNGMVENLNMLIDQVYKQKILTQNAQLKQLQSQINPHFLYNSYFILNRMVVLEDNENAARFSQQLGVYLKFITRNAEEDVPLSIEVEHARIYAKIQEMRFISRIKVEFCELPEEFYNIYVPRLILQPIIENAFEHGLENKAKDGMLVIYFQSRETGLYIVVEDNGTGMDDEKLDFMNKVLDDSEKASTVENTGIINIHRRLQYKFGTESGLIISRSELGGLKTVLKIIYRRGQGHV